MWFEFSMSWNGRRKLGAVASCAAPARVGKKAVIQSCGRCVPCALGSRRALEAGLRLVAAAGGDAAGRLDARRGLEDLLDTMEAASLCAFGQLMPGPLRTIAGKLPDTGAAGVESP